MTTPAQTSQINSEIGFIKGALDQAQRLHYQNQYEASDKLCKEVLNRVPEHVMALHIHVMNLRVMGNYQQAEEALVRLTNLVDDNNADVLYEWGALRAQQGDYREADNYLSKVINLNPKHANAYMVRGRMHDRLGNLGKAMEMLQRAHELRPGDETICKDMAGVYARLGLRDTAVQYVKKAYNINPKYVDGLVYWANLLELEGKFDRALAILDSAREIEPENKLIALQEGVIYRRKKEYDRALECFDSIEPAQINSFAQASYYKQKARTLESLGRYDDAFTAYGAMASVNTAPPLNFNYPAEAYGEQFERVKAFWEKDEISSLPRIALPDDASKPVFIAGFPRSGTTLLEQMLGRHSEIFSIGETHSVESSIGGLANLENFAGIHQAMLVNSEKVLRKFQSNFYSDLKKQALLEPGYQYFTEKTPLNETYLGLIHHAMDGARVIHMIRHPLNSVMSAFFNEVRHGKNCAATLESTALHYSRVMDLVALYQDKLEMDYLPVRYEDLVADHEGKAREIIDFIGLDWQDSCIQHEKSKRVVRTPSYEQVSEKIYTHSVERYKPFLKHLEPIIPILQPYIEKYGYTIEE